MPSMFLTAGDIQKYSSWNESSVRKEKDNKQNKEVNYLGCQRVIRTMEKSEAGMGKVRTERTGYNLE